MINIIGEDYKESDITLEDALKELEDLMESFILIHSGYRYYNGLLNIFAKDFNKRSTYSKIMSSIESSESELKDRISLLCDNCFEFLDTNLSKEWVKLNPQYKDIWDYMISESRRRGALMRKVNNLN
jgi:ABC-type uncharacterized transport system ATPase subunit